MPKVFFRPTPPVLARSLGDTGTMLGVSRSTVLRMLDRGELQRIRVGSRVMVSEQSIRALLRQPASEQAA